MWRLAVDCVLHTPADIDAAAALSDRLHRALEASAERLGWSYGYTGDLSRVLRAPGTVYRKAGQERLCRVIESDGPFHHLDDLDKALPPLSPKGVAPRHDQGGQDADGPFDALRRAGWSDILEPVGWSYVKHDHRGELWMRPGDAESEYSAVAFEDVFYVHSTSTVLPDREGMSEGTLFAALHHGGNLSAAAHDLIGAATGGTATRAALSLPPDVLAAIADTQTAPTWEPLSFPALLLEALYP